MSEPKPVVPTRIIPPGESLPTAPPLPPAPHGAEDVPPWRTVAPPPAPPPHEPAAPPPPPHGAGGEQRVVVEVWYPQSEPQPEDPPSRWSMAWLWRHAHPWKTSLGGALALLPIPWTGYSAATTWAYTVDQSRDFGWAWGYGLAAAALGLAVLADTRRARILTRAALVVAVAGVFGAIDPFDLITITTGVQR